MTSVSPELAPTEVSGDNIRNKKALFKFFICARALRDVTQGRPTLFMKWDNSAPLRLSNHIRHIGDTVKWHTRYKVSYVLDRE